MVQREVSSLPCLRFGFEPLPSPSMGINVRSWSLLL
uniref:Uncharacterized protein n=1 Tax=Rhizophora mucronata TaxID=61149 RepID=A0A2P2L606_RHIMU